jgi:predicted ATPase
MILDTLVVLLKRKVNRLSADVRETLKIASLIGFHFAESVFLEAVKRLSPLSKEELFLSAASTVDTATVSLESAAGEGFVERNKGGFQFIHHKLQA